MPVIFVFGVPKKNQQRLQDFCDQLKAAVCAGRELELKEEQVSCFFPADLLKDGLGEEIIIFVEGLFNEPGRDEKVRKELAERLANCAARFFPEALSECFIKTFDSRQGFATVSPKFAKEKNLA